MKYFLLFTALVIFDPHAYSVRGKQKLNAVTKFAGMEELHSLLQTGRKLSVKLYHIGSYYHFLKNFTIF